MENSVKETASGPQITIVIATLNRPQVVMKLINQLVEASKKNPLEVLVIDQSNKNDFHEFLKIFPRLRNFRLLYQKKVNYCASLNVGWKEANSSIVLFLDDDVEITRDTICSHLNAYKNNKIMGVAGRVINDGETIAEGSDVGKVKWYGSITSLNFSSKESTYVDFPYGCNMSFRKSLLVDLFGFDEKLLYPSFSYNEVDLGYRLNRKYPNSLIFSPEALVYHHRHKTGGTRNNYGADEIFHSNQFNYGYFLGKNFNWIENILCFTRRLPYQLLKEPQAIIHILQGFIYAKKINR